MSTASGTPAGPHVDPRGQRFAAAFTSVVLLVALVAAPSTLTTALLAAQAVFFLAGAALGPARTPYAAIYRRLVLPRVGKPRELEPAAPPRFAQAVGLVFALVALVGVAVGSAAVTLVAIAMALLAAFLNAAFAFCLGCEMYLLLLRVTPRRLAA
jgi:disulfide bond formation protein DsbB